MKKISEFFLTENFQFLVVKFSIYLNRCVFVMRSNVKRQNNCLARIGHYENTPIQIYSKFHLKN